MDIRLKDSLENQMECTSITEWPNGGIVSLQGYINIGYDKLVEKLGDSEIEDGEKTDAAWWLKFKDGTFATIYNYKDGVNYLGTSGLRVGEITEWHIGGTNRTAVERVHELFGVV